MKMKSKIIPVLGLCAVCTAIGLGSGYYSGTRDAHAPGRLDAAHAAGADDEHGGHAPEAPLFAPETLQNMGVKIGRAALSTFSLSLAVPAEVGPAPRARQAVFAPIAGRIHTLDAVFGSVVRAGDAVATLIRDPLPRVELVLTKHVLEPASETLHETMSAYRRAVVSRDISLAEHARLAAFSGQGDEPVVPRHQLIQVDYDLRRAEREVTSLRHELERHGLTLDQIESVEQGRFPVIDVGTWRRALEQNGLWSPRAGRIFERLPQALRAAPWTVATIGEILAGGFDAEGLLAWLETQPEAGRHILEIGGLLQRGHSLADVRQRFSLGAFAPQVTVRAPAGEPVGAVPDWDVAALHVTPGQHVESGEPLVTLENARRVFLEVQPTGSEIDAVSRAIAHGTVVGARPLVPGAGPELTGLRIERLAYESRGKVVAYLPVENIPLAEVKHQDGVTLRTWQLGQGLRYLVNLPTRTLENVYVFPASALAEIGPDMVLFRKSGDRFQPVKVVVMHRDHEVVVVPGTTDIFPGNPMVTHGAFALGLAMQAADSADNGSGGAHAGHGH